jgi:hypothetical protein
MAKLQFFKVQRFTQLMQGDIPIILAALYTSRVV